MATKQKRAALRKRSPPKKGKKKRRGALQRFLISFTSTAAAVFGIASCVLHPQLTDALRSLPYLSQFDWHSVSHTTPSIQTKPGSTTTRFKQCPQFFPGGQPPQLPTGDHLRELCFSAFAVLHNAYTKTPFVVVERLNRATLLRAQKQQRTDKFYAEARLPRAERAELEDYRGSGYSRGHMAPAADMPTPEAMAQSFSLANMVPQDQVHNAGAWAKIEQDTRKYVMRAQGDVFVYTGPLFGTKPPTVGSGRVAVPSHLFKVVYDPSTRMSWAHLHANRPDTQVGPPMRYVDFVQQTKLELLTADAVSK